jgi:hypothetical protein
MDHQRIAALCVAWICVCGAAQQAKAQDATQALTQADVEAISANLKAIRDYIAGLEAQRKALEPGPDDGLAQAGLDKVGVPAAAPLSGALLGDLGHQAERLENVLKHFASSDVGHQAEGLEDVLKRFANNPGQKFFSRFAGITQTEPSIGWCGRNAVVGFNDTGSVLKVLLGLFSPSHSVSLSGFAFSRDAGETFIQGPPLFADPLPPGLFFRQLLGQPVVGCTDSSTFYYSSLALEQANVFPFPIVPGIAVSISTDGGQTFSRTVMAVRKPPRGVGNFHILDKEWMAVAPGPGGGTLHVTYTDFDLTGRFCRSLRPQPGPAPFTAIEYVRSTDGGATWSQPIVIDEVCGFAPVVSGSQVRTGVGDDVFVAWESYPTLDNRHGFGGPRSIKIRRSSDGGASFGPASTVTGVTPVGNGFALQGNFRAFFDLQGLAVDRSGGRNTGTIYVTWHDGRSLQVPEPFGPGGLTTYGFADVLLSRSTDGGATWSAPVRVNDDPVGLAVDHFMPAATVDREGNVFVAFYDRRNDPRNFLIDTFLAKSEDGGRRWSNERLTKRSFPPARAQDRILFESSDIGDYISVAADSTGSFEGVIAAWGDNSLGNLNVAFVKKE